MSKCRMNRTRISWCNYTWNPIVGCSAASTGCANCWARGFAFRRKYKWGKTTFMPGRLDHASSVKVPGRIFVAGMSDLGHPTVDPKWIDAIIEAMQKAPQHQYIVLTKRPGRWLSRLPANVWVGVSIENQDFMWRLDRLNKYARPGALRFISVSPMLGPITFKNYRGRKPDWVIASPETGKKKRPCEDAWIDSLAEESAVFMDQRKYGTRKEIPCLTNAPNPVAPNIRGCGSRLN